MPISKSKKTWLYFGAVTIPRQFLAEINYCKITLRHRAHEGTKRGIEINYLISSARTAAIHSALLHVLCGRLLITRWCSRPHASLTETIKHSSCHLLLAGWSKLYEKVRLIMMRPDFLSFQRRTFVCLFHSTQHKLSAKTNISPRLREFFVPHIIY